MSYFHDASMREQQLGDADAAGEHGSIELRDAKRLFAAFSGRDAQVLGPRCIDRVVPDVLVDLGALRGVIYSRDHGGQERTKGRTYIHFMEDPPRLMCDASGRRLFVIGGSYRITCRGIEG